MRKATGGETAVVAPNSPGLFITAFLYSRPQRIKERLSILLLQKVKRLERTDGEWIKGETLLGLQLFSTPLSKVYQFQTTVNTVLKSGIKKLPKVSSPTSQRHQLAVVVCGRSGARVIQPEVKDAKLVYSFNCAVTDQTAHS